MPAAYGDAAGADEPRRAVNRKETMTERSLDELGPVDYLVVEFPAGKANFSGEMANELSNLIELSVVRVLDLLILQKEPDGSLEAFESHDFGVPYAHDVQGAGVIGVKPECFQRLVSNDIREVDAVAHTL